LNLLPINLPSQTGDSNLVADKTINSSHREKVPQQKARSHALASPPLVASDEMTPLEPADQHPAISQKLPTSKQPTPPAAPASAPPFPSALIAPSPLFLNLFPINPPSQTGDSHLVAYTTINSSRKEKVQRQQGQDIGRQIWWSKSRSRRNLFRHAATTADTVIPCSSMLVDRPPSLLPFPIDGHG